MAPFVPLPISPAFQESETYVCSLLDFVTSNDLFMTLCGGVHILDFFTQDPDVYETLLPLDWREWFNLNDIGAVVDFLLHLDSDQNTTSSMTGGRDLDSTWRGTPPASLLEYVRNIQKHCLQRDFPLPRRQSSSSPSSSSAKFSASQPAPPQIKPDIAVGMKPKKAHEVSNFAAYVNRLCDSILETQHCGITNIVDFGAGQNYLGRTLASQPYNRHIIAIESRQGNIEGARGMDVSAKLAKKKATLWNKKLSKHFDVESISSEQPNQGYASSQHSLSERKTGVASSNIDAREGSVRYIEHEITDGDLSNVISILPPSSSLMIISLHSCGNLIHHGIRSLLLNPSVKAVALIGCCYNLMTERLGPPSYKLPSLRPPSERVDRLSASTDPHGFPMSSRLVDYSHNKVQGIRLNITARMMAVQAPANWTAQECEGFFTRHFFRALLQRIFVDRDLLPASSSVYSPAIIIGSLRKRHYTSFVAYVRGAAQKISTSHDRGPEIKASLDALTDSQIEDYETRNRHRKKQLSVVWSLMAFSAGVVESLIVVDRWLFLKESPELVEDCWVEPVFEYGLSPRNLVVVGVKRGKGLL